MAKSHLLHVVPVGDDAVLNGVLQSQDTSLALSLVSYVAVLLTHTHHHTLEEGCTEVVRNRAIVKRLKKRDLQGHLFTGSAITADTPGDSKTIHIPHTYLTHTSYISLTARVLCTYSVHYRD